MVKSTMIIRDGKFYRDGVPVPLEFGNIEQIKLMKDYQDRIDAFAGEGLEVEVEYEVRAYINFECICGKNLQVETLDEDIIPGSYVEETSVMNNSCKCHNCKRQYKVCEDDFGSTVLKLQKP